MLSHLLAIGWRCGHILHCHRKFILHHLLGLSQQTYERNKFLTLLRLHSLDPGGLSQLVKRVTCEFQNTLRKGGLKTRILGHRILKNRYTKGHDFSDIILQIISLGKSMAY